MTIQSILDDFDKHFDDGLAQWESSAVKDFIRTKISALLDEYPTEKENIWKIDGGYILCRKQGYNKKAKEVEDWLEKVKSLT